MVKVCVDVDYREDGAIAAAVLFHDWADATPAGQVVEHLSSVEPYVPGQFYRRELPCLVAVFAHIHDPIDLVIVDGYVWLGEDRPGLGAHLFEALGQRIPIIGIAKTRFASARQAVAVHRGQLAKRPLFVTAAGIDVNEAARLIESMHGPHRLPTMVKRVDSLCRET
jgi:deoxyribonuclease V